MAKVELEGELSEVGLTFNGVLRRSLRAWGSGIMLSAERDDLSRQAGQKGVAITV